ncbi:hypothetical protein BDN70DRAFT_931615 [Pholiota conissans]|uniref:Uncharacterized protein n=1 Tax=Pholiota conissans TaxID=109636 RepID=A0A9P5Z4B7_9AGAR|nr:hypothetical protein BDN70DRAFT_931615 [Pholiota conissans]
MPLRASALTLPMPTQTLSGFSIHTSSPERSSTPFPESAGSDRFDYPFPTTQTQTSSHNQSPPPCASHVLPSPSFGLPPTSLLPSPSSPWPSPVSMTPPMHTPRPLHPVHRSGFLSPRSGPSSPVSSIPTAHAHRSSHAHATTPARLCAQASANAPMPPSLARKMGFSPLPRA